MVIHGQFPCPCNLRLLTRPCWPLVSSLCHVLTCARRFHLVLSQFQSVKDMATRKEIAIYTQWDSVLAYIPMWLPQCLHSKKLTNMSSTWSTNSVYRPVCLYWQSCSIASHTSHLQLTVASLLHDQKSAQTSHCDRLGYFSDFTAQPRANPSSTRSFGKRWDLWHCQSLQPIACLQMSRHAGLNRWV
jgi:hypothetical protein